MYIFLEAGLVKYFLNSETSFFQIIFSRFGFLNIVSFCHSLLILCAKTDY